jgi:hypothetical protein
MRRKLHRQMNVRLPDLTLDQIERLCAKLGATKAQVIILAVDRMAQRELGDSPAAQPEGGADSPDV